MAQLAGGAVSTGDHFAVADHAGADTGAERHKDQAVVASSGALPQLAHGGSVGVVQKAHVGMGESCLEGILHTQQIQAQVGDDGDVAVGRHGAGNGQANALERRGVDAVVVERGLHAAGHRAVAGLVNQRRGGYARAAHNLTLGGDDADLYRGTAHVDAHEQLFSHRYSPFLGHAPPKFQKTVR